MSVPHLLINDSKASLSGFSQELNDRIDRDNYDAFDGAHRTNFATHENNFNVFGEVRLIHTSISWFSSLQSIRLLKIIYKESAERLSLEDRYAHIV